MVMLSIHLLASPFRLSGDFMLQIQTFAFKHNFLYLHPKIILMEKKTQHPNCERICPAYVGLEKLS